MALHEYQRKMYIKIATVAALVILPLAGFGIGVQYGKSSNKAPASASSQGLSPSGQMPSGANGQRPNIGTIKAISETSITVESQMDGSDTTLAITTSTQVTDDQESASVSDITTGDTVVVIADSSNSSQASQIMLNPSMGSSLQ